MAKRSQLNRTRNGSDSFLTTQHTHVPRNVQRPFDPAKRSQRRVERAFGIDRNPSKTGNQHWEMVLIELSAPKIVYPRRFISRQFWGRSVTKATANCNCTFLNSIRLAAKSPAPGRNGRRKHILTYCLIILINITVPRATMAAGCGEGQSGSCPGGSSNRGASARMSSGVVCTQGKGIAKPDTFLITSARSFCVFGVRFVCFGGLWTK